MFGCDFAEEIKRFGLFDPKLLTTGLPRTNFLYMSAPNSAIAKHYFGFTTGTCYDPCYIRNRIPKETNKLQSEPTLSKCELMLSV